MEEKDIFNALMMYRTRGDYLRRVERYPEAKLAYDEAFKRGPTDVRVLLGRSRAAALTAAPKEAYAAAEQALQLEPENIPAVNVQAQAMFALGDFERSIVMNSRGYRRRRQPPYFLEGKNQGLQTLQDCIGVGSGQFLLDSKQLICEMEEKHASFDDNAPQKSARICRIPQLQQKPKITQSEARRHLALSRVMANKYLGQMARDKFFLEELLEDPRLDSANTVGNRQLREIVKNALEYLQDRQDTLRTQRPYYAIQLEEKTHSAYQTKFKEEVLQRERTINATLATHLLEALEDIKAKKQISKLMSKAQCLQTFFDTKTPRTLPDKHLFMDKLYQIVGEGYLFQYRLSMKHEDPSHRHRIAFLMGLPLKRQPSFDSVIANYTYMNCDVKKETEKLQGVLEMCEHPIQGCCLYYELARLAIAQKNYALGKFYGKRCQRDAEENESGIWWLNGCLVLISGEMQQGNPHEVRQLVESARPWLTLVAKSCKIAWPREFMEKCVEISAEPVEADDRKEIMKREQQILALMEEPERVEMRVLFRRIASLPLRRRLKVLPGKPEPENLQSERRRRRQPGLTVVPGAPITLRAPPRSGVKGFQVFDL